MLLRQIRDADWVGHLAMCVATARNLFGDEYDGMEKWTEIDEGELLMYHEAVEEASWNV
jgi:hypothetical protein